MSMLRSTTSFGIYDEISNPKYPIVDVPYTYEGVPRHVSYDPFKLHIIFNIEGLDLVRPQLDALLKDAAQDLTISCFKVVNKERLKAQNIKHWRNNNVVYTLYLLHEFTLENATKVIALCKKIEDLLRLAKIPKIEAKEREVGLTIAEIMITDFLMFRAANTAENLKKGICAYIDTFSNPAVLPLLREAGLGCDYYKTLKPALTSMPDYKHTAAAAPATLSEHVAAGKSPLSAAPLKKDDAESHVYSCTMTRGRSRLVY